MSSWSSSAETVANIEGLLKQILISIPALSLLRFKSVSKHWLSLISDPDFRRRHSLRNPNPKVSAFFSPKANHDSFNSIPLQTPPSNPFKTLKDSDLTVLQSCNGLFLLAGDQTNRRRLRAVHVVNPTTNEFHTLSAPPSLAMLEEESYLFLRYGLVFDPRMSPNYSVVCVSHDEIYGKRHRIEIYSSETGAWGSSSLEAPFFLRPPPYDASWQQPLHFNDESREGAVYCNGAVHWIRKEAGLPLCRRRIGEVETEGFERDDSDVMHYFNIVEGSLRIVTAAPPVPVVVKEFYKEYKVSKTLVFPEIRQRYFGESGGRLCLIEVIEHCPTQVEVMEMERDYSSWCVKYIVDLGPVAAPLPGQGASAFVVLFMEKDDEDSTADLWLHMPGKVVFYDLSTMSVRTSVELDGEEHFLGLDGDEYETGLTGSFPYMETLACV